MTRRRNKPFRRARAAVMQAHQFTVATVGLEHNVRMMSPPTPASPLRVVARNPTRTVDLVVVVGMHRSGTSAITRSLRAVGVQLGDNLMPPHPDQNPKGFWEDLDVNRLNVEMLAALGREWHSLARISEHEVVRLRQAGFMLRAAEIVRAKLSIGAPFAFKDPRISKLLPFWREVFRATHLKVAYVIAVRNPLSVVRSLAKRNDMPAEQAYYLWLEHMMPMLDSIAADNHVFVEYDRLLASPRGEIGRIASTLCLDVNEEEVVAFEQEFLDPGLRHTEFGTGDLLLDDSCPELVLDVYNVLLGLASAEVGADDDWSRRLPGWKEQLQSLEPALRFADKLTKRVEALKVQAQAQSAAKEEVASLQSAFAAKAEEALQLGAAVARAEAQAAERVAQVGVLEQSHRRLDEEVSQLTGALSASRQEAADRAAAQDAAVASSETLTQRNSALEAALDAANAEAEHHKLVIAALEQTQRDLSSEIALLSDAVAHQTDEAARTSSENAALSDAQGKLRQEHDGLARALAAAQERCAEQAGRIVELLALKGSLESEIERITATAAATQHQVVRQAAEIKALAEGSDRLAQEIEGLTGQRVLLSSQVVQEQAHARRLVEQHAHVLASTERRANEVAERGEALAARFAELATASEAVRDQLNAARVDSLASARHNAELERQIEQLVADLSSSEHAKAAIEHELEDVRGQRALITSQLAEVQDHARLAAEGHVELLSRAEQRADAVAERGEALAAHLAELSTMSGDVRDQLNVVREEGLAFARQNAELQRQLEELRAGLVSREHTIVSLEEAMQQQRMTNHELVLTLIARHDPVATPARKGNTLGAMLRRWLSDRASR
jgi:hypothetical protein